MQKSFSCVRQVLQIGPARARWAGTGGAWWGSGFLFSSIAAVIGFAELKSKKRYNQTKTATTRPADAAVPELTPSLPLAVAMAKRRWFRVLAATLIPLLVLGAAEAGLRVAGYGYPAGFFLKSRFGGRAVYIENQKFGYRFFPRALARVPEPEVLPVEKAPSTYRIFVFG